MRLAPFSFGICVSLALVTSLKVSAMEGQTSGSIPAPKANSLAWLEERTGSRALEWVRVQSMRTIDQLTADRRYAEFRAAAVQVTQDESRLPGDSVGGWIHESWIYRVWTDNSHPRGLLQRTLLETYGDPIPSWTTLLDIDAFGRRAGKAYDIALGKCLGSRCLLGLVVGGATDSILWKEFDVDRRSFVKDGFAFVSGTLPIWKGKDTVIVAKARHADGSLNSDPLAVVQELRRGTPLETAKVLYRSDEVNGIFSVAEFNSGKQQHLVIEETTVPHGQRLFLLADHGEPVLMHGPNNYRVMTFYDGHWIFLLGSEAAEQGNPVAWKSGSLLAIPEAGIFSSAAKGQLVMGPNQRETIDSVQGVDGGLMVVSHENVRGRLLRFTFNHGQWLRDVVPIPDFGTIDTPVFGTSHGRIIARYSSFLQPTTYYLVEARTSRATFLKSRSELFDASGLVTEQFEATSLDGTRIPYFMVRPKALRYNGKTPTILHGYGGNGSSQYPEYDGVLGRLWLEKGGAYVVANIRGGGEFGPAWHEAAIKTKRHRAYEDFIGVAEDLISRRITSPRYLGVDGHSNGGGLVGVMLTKRPELFNAAVAANGVLDMIRTDLQSHTSEIEKERGSPRIPEERAFLERYSPYQNLRKGLDMPVPLLVTATTDEIVSPAMTRKFAATMEELELPFLFYESPEGGHAMAVTLDQLATWAALKYTYLAQRLSDVKDIKQVAAQ